MSRAAVKKDARLIKREIALKINLKKRKKFKEKIKKNDSTVRQMD
jgi:hypothetical protein